MLPHHSQYPPTTLPPTSSSYSSITTNPPRPTSSSLERLPPSTSLHEYRSLAYLQNPYLSQRHTPSDHRVVEGQTIGSQRYNHQLSERQIPFRTSSASPAPYESQTSLADSKRGSSYLQETFKPIQNSQSSYNNLGQQFASKSDSKHADTFFTFKKDSNQFINFSDMSSVHYASSEPHDSVVNKMLFSAESKKFRAEARLEENKINADNSLQLPEFRESQQTEPNKQKLETPNKLIKCLELLNTPSTPPKTDKKENQFTFKQPYIESPDMLRQPSLDHFTSVAPPSVATNQVKTRLISEITAFNFDSVGRENESNSLMKNTSSLKNPSYCTQSPSMKYNSHPVNRFEGARDIEKELGMNIAANYKSQGPEEPKNISNHNYYSYLSSITLQSDEQGKGKERTSMSKRSVSSQPSIRQQMSLQEIGIGSKNSLDPRKGESQQNLERGDEGYIIRKKEKDSPGRESRKSVNKLKSILKPNMSVSSSNSPENKKKVSYSSEVLQTDENNNNMEQTNKYIQRLQAAAKAEKIASPDRVDKKGVENLAKEKTTEEGEIRESTEEWLQKASNRASQILGRLSQRRAVSPINADQSQSQSQIQQDKTLRSITSLREEKQEAEKKSKRSISVNNAQKPVEVVSTIQKVPKEEKRSPPRGRVNVEVKISDLLLMAERSQSPPKEKKVEDKISNQKQEKIEKVEKVEVNRNNSVAELKPKSSVPAQESRDHSVEKNTKPQEETKPTFFKEKPVVSPLVKEEVRPLVQAIKQMTKLEVIKEQSSGRDSQRKSEQDSSKEYKNSSNRGASANTRGTNGLDTSDMQYSDSQTSSNNIVCIGSRVPTSLSKEGESRQPTEEGAAVAKSESMIGSQRQMGPMETPERANNVMKTGEINEKLVYLCRSLKEKDFAVLNHQSAANVSDLEEFQKIIMSKIEGIHSDIIEKINLISKKIDSEPVPSAQYATATTQHDGTCSPYINHSFSEVHSPYSPYQHAKEVKPPQYPHHQHQQNHQSQQQQQLKLQQQQYMQQQAQQSNNVSAVNNENCQKSGDNASSEIYEYDSQSRTYSIRQNPIPTSKDIKTTQRSALVENPFSNRSKSRERLGSNCTSVNTSNNASILCDQLGIENVEKRHNNLPIKDLMQQQQEQKQHDQPKSVENKSSKQLQQELFSTYNNNKLQQQRMVSKLANMIPRDLPRPLTSKSQNRLSPNIPDLQYKNASQSESVGKQMKAPGMSYSGSAPRGLFEGDLNLSGKSFSEKKESLESELNKSWGTNIRFSAKRNSMAPKEKSPVKSSPQKVTRSSMSSQSSEKKLAIFNSSPILEDKKSREYREQQSKSYLVLSPDYSVPASKDSNTSRQLDTVNTQYGGQVHSVNHEMQRLEKKLEKYLKAGPAFELEPIKEMANSEAYFSQGMGTRAQSLTKVGSAKQLDQVKKSEGNQSTRALNKWDVKGKEIMSNRGGNFGQIPKSVKKAVIANSFRGKEKYEREDLSPDNVCNLSKDKSMEKSPGMRSANKVKGFVQDNGSKPAPRKSVCY